MPQPDDTPRLVLFAGPAGAGKSTLAAAWCRTRTRAVLVELDEVREGIVSGRADPRLPGDTQTIQYDLGVAACLALARVWLGGGYDVAITDVLDPEAYGRHWHGRLGGLDPRLVVVLPSLDVTLARAAARTKPVPLAISAAQHRASLGWHPALRIDTSNLDPAASLPFVIAALTRDPRP